MNLEDAPSDAPATTGTHPAAAVIADLRLRLQGSQAQVLAARAEARRLARELAFTRRLLKFAEENPPPAPSAPSVTAPAAAEVVDASPRRAVTLAGRMIYHVDACESHGTFTAISGWAFCPVPGWNGQRARAMLQFRHGAAVFHAPAWRVPRPDVAAHYASAGGTGGASGLDGIGFASEILHDSLPKGVELEVSLRLECAGLACEQPLGKQLRL